MGFKRIICLTVLFLLGIGMGFGLTRFESDPAHSSIVFSIRHMMLSRVTGNFNDFSVVINANPDNIVKSNVEAVIKTASVDTKNADRDKHLRSKDFFEVEKYPEMTFKSTQIVSRGESYVAFGILTMHGVSRNIELPFSITGNITDQQGNKRVGLEMHTALNRKDYNITWNSTLDKGGLALGEEVKIDIYLEMVEKKANDKK